VRGPDCHRPDRGASVARLVIGPMRRGSSEAAGPTAGFGKPALGGNRTRAAYFRTALPGPRQSIDSGLPRLLAAFMPPLSAHEDGRAYVIAPLEAIAAFAPAKQVQCCPPLV